MPFPPHEPRSKSSSSRGNSHQREPGKRQVASVINCEEINRACDAYFIRTIPGYRPMNIAGHPAKRTA